MKLYTVTPKYKKTLVEVQVLRKETQTVCLNTTWRSGTFVVAIPDQEYEEVITADAIDLDEFNYEMLDTWDGVALDITVSDFKLSDDEIDALVEQYEKVNEEEFIDSWLEDEQGFEYLESIYYIEGEVNVEEYLDDDYSHLLEEDDD